MSRLRKRSGMSSGAAMMAFEQMNALANALQTTTVEINPLRRRFVRDDFETTTCSRDT